MQSLIDFTHAVERLKSVPDLVLYQMDIADPDRPPYRHVTAEFRGTPEQILTRLPELGALALELHAHFTMFTGSNAQQASRSISVSLSVSRLLGAEEKIVTNYVVL